MLMISLIPCPAPCIVYEYRKWAVSRDYILREVVLEVKKFQEFPNFKKLF